MPLAYLTSFLSRFFPKYSSLSSHLKLGKAGEERAVRFLQNRRYKIIARNYHFKGGEIDIIARQKDVLIFVEVKSRINTDFSQPREAVNAKKAEKILQTASHFCQKYQLRDFIIRFDIVEVTSVSRKFLGRGFKVTHYPDVLALPASY